MDHKKQPSTSSTQEKIFCDRCIIDEDEITDEEEEEE